MKTKFKIGGLVIVIFLVALTRIAYSEKTNDVSLLNVEALARGENGSACFLSGSVDCPISGDKVYAVY